MVKDNILVVYNVCGIRGIQNTDYYIAALNGILAQEDRRFHLAISSCLSIPAAEAVLRKYQKEHPEVSLNLIYDKMPVNCSFNKTVQDCVHHFGLFRGFLYLDSGISWENNKNTLGCFFKELETEEYGMIAANPSTDDGMSDFFRGKIPQDDKYLIGIGQATNLHAQYFSHLIYEAFNEQVIPSVFANHCSESSFSGICASIGLRWLFLKYLVVKHNQNMDGASSGYPCTHLWDNTFLSLRSMREICLDPEGIAAGFPFEENKYITHHDPSQFDENYRCKNNRLYPFIRKNLYLSRGVFDYGKIKHEFIA